MKNKANHRVLNIYVILLTINLLWFRGYWIENFISFSLFTPVLVLIIILIIIIKFRNQLKKIKNHKYTLFILFILLIWFNLFVGFLFFGVDLNIGVLTILDIMLGMLVYFVSYTLFKYNIINYKIFTIIVIITGTILSLYIILSSLAISDLRRFQYLGTGVNYLANGLSVSFVLLLYYLLSQKKSLVIVLITLLFLIINLTGIFLTGARSSLLGIVFVVIYLFYSFRKNIRIYSYLLIIFILFTSILIYMNTIGTMDLLFQRYIFLDNDFISNSGRLQLWKASVEDLSIQAFIFGRPHLNEIYSEGMIHPHNYFFSILRYNGVFVLIIFSIFLLKTIKKFSELNIRYKVPIFSIFFVIFFYINVSGNFSRIYTFVFIIGMMAGLLKADKGCKKLLQI